MALTALLALVLGACDGGGDGAENAAEAAGAPTSAAATTSTGEDSISSSVTGRQRNRRVEVLIEGVEPPDGR